MKDIKKKRRFLNCYYCDGISSELQACAVGGASKPCRSVRRIAQRSTNMQIQMNRNIEIHN